MSTNQSPCLTTEDLWDLATYAERREDLRRQTMELKKDRRILIGKHLCLCIENRATIFYQIMEILRIENIDSREQMTEELAAYNPLISGNGALKVTLLIQYEEEEVRRVQLRQLKNLEDHLWLQIGDRPRIQAIADEDMERSNAEKTSAVHFLRYPVREEEVQALKKDAQVVFGCDHPHYHQRGEALNKRQCAALLQDLCGV